MLGHTPGSAGITGSWLSSSSTATAVNMAPFWQQQRTYQIEIGHKCPHKFMLDTKMTFDTQDETLILNSWEFKFPCAAVFKLTY